MVDGVKSIATTQDVKMAQNATVKTTDDSKKTILLTNDSTIKDTDMGTKLEKIENSLDFIDGKNDPSTKKTKVGKILRQTRNVLGKAGTILTSTLTNAVALPVRAPFVFGGKIAHLIAPHSKKVDLYNGMDKDNPKGAMTWFVHLKHGVVEPGFVEKGFFKKTESKNN